MAEEGKWHPRRPPRPVVRRLSWDGSRTDAEMLLRREWLVTNGLGGFASGTVSGACTRKYHGLLVAALPVPQGRMVMLTNIWEELRFPDDSTAELGGEQPAAGEAVLPGTRYLTEFRLENGLPVWRFEIRGWVIEKRILLPHMQNTVLINYRLVQGEGPVRLRLFPLMHFRAMEADVSVAEAMAYTVTANANRYEVRAENYPFLRMYLYGDQGSFNLSGGRNRKVVYSVEQSRGYASTGSLWNPGFFRVMLKGEEATLLASTEPWNTTLALDPAEAFRAEGKRRRRLLAAADREAQAGIGAELVLAADQFIITPVTRIVDATWAHAGGDEIRTIIAGYHWFTDWGRDTMISLEGLTLATGRFAEAGYILRTFAHYVRNGLIPNMFPEGEAEGLYHTADASLWFFHAIDRYVHFTGDLTTLDLLMPTLVDIVLHHIRGTSFGIGVDHDDGLLRQGQEGYQLTWMDAKVGDWVVTPRRGKAVEINALWYNALRLLEGWLGSEGSEEDTRPYTELAARVYESFNRRFWIEERGYLYDVIDGEEGHDDPSLRPNQVLAISLTHPVLDPSRWRPVLDVVKDRLLTPVGLRSLASGHPDYKTRYYGDLRARDAAYHQGTVWAWLIGPFVDAWLKAHPEERTGARRFLDGLVSHLDEACIGSISEIFDADPPNSPEGCVAQAWSVAEFLRCWMNTGEE